MLAAVLMWLQCAAALGESGGYLTVKINGLTYLLSDAPYYDVPEAVATQARSLYRGLAEAPEVRSYVYLINSSRTVSMDRIDEEPRIYKSILKYFDRSGTDYLRLQSLEDYARYYYTTDHHWNYQGSYAGYRQIVEMLLGAEEPVLEPVETVVFPVKFNGSMNKTMNRTDSQEDFTVYRFDYPEMKVEINGRRKAAFGNQEAYFAGKYSKMPLANHYSYFYGGEEGLVHFETDREDRGNLLVFSNSQSNALNMLLASHFHHTWIVDPRHYEADTGAKFSLSRAVREWDIGQVLILGDGLYFRQNYHYE